jgi:hypothetical protein
MAKKQTSSRPPAPLFYPQWPEQDRRHHAHKLLPFVGESNMPDWVKRDIERLLIDVALGSRTSGGRPRTPQWTQHRIALALAWLKKLYPDLKQKQRDGIVCNLLDVKRRALITIAATHHQVAAASLSRWQNTPEGEIFGGALNDAALRERAKLSRLKS